MSSKPVDTAIVMIVGPCIDSGDFKSLEEAIAYNAAGMDISLIVEKTDGTSAVTAITLTTAGTSDWTHKDGGYYEVEITAAQNAEEGIAYLRGVCTGVLPFESPRYDIVVANIYDSLVKGTDKLQVDLMQCGGSVVAAGAIPNAAADAAGGLPVSDAGGLDLDAILDGATLLLSSTIHTVNSQTNLIVNDGSIFTNSYKDQMVVIYDVSISNFQSVRRITGSSYDGANAIISLDSAPDYTVVAGDIVKIFAANTASVPSASEVVDEWESQSQADPTGFHVNVKEVNGTSQTANDNSADINSILSDVTGIAGDAMRGTDDATLAATWTDARAVYLDNLSVGAVALASGVDLTSIHGAALTETVNGYLAAAFTKLFDVATPLLVASEVMRGTDSAALASTALSDAMWTDARAGALTDWLNGGRLDLILDIIAADTTTEIPALVATAQADLDIITGADGVTLATAQAFYAPNTVVPDEAGVAPTAAEIKTAIEAAGSHLALILTDTNELQTDWVNGGRLDLLLDAIKLKTDELPSGMAKNVAVPKFDVFMVLASDHVTAATGKTVVGTISKDGGAFASLANSITEVGYGVYTIADGLTQAERNADVSTLKFVADDCDARIITIISS